MLAASADGAVAHAYMSMPGVHKTTIPVKMTRSMPLTVGAAKSGTTTTAVSSHSIPHITAWIARFEHGAAAYVVVTCRNKSRRAMRATCWHSRFEYGGCDMVALIHASVQRGEVVRVTMANGGAKNAAYSKPGILVAPKTIYRVGADR